MPDFLDLLNSLIKLGLPMAGLSWFIFHQLYSSGDMNRDADRKAVNSRIKSLNASFKKRKKNKAKEIETARVNPVLDKWMWFGGGFYGLAALWTFVIIEISDLFNFIFHYPGNDALFGAGLISLIVDVLLNQLQNIIAAFVWFGFWDADSVLLLVLVAYAGYWVGVEMARREVSLPVAMWREKIRALVKPPHS